MLRHDSGMVCATPRPEAEGETVTVRVARTVAVTVVVGDRDALLVQALAVRTAKPAVTPARQDLDIMTSFRRCRCSRNSWRSRRQAKQELTRRAAVDSAKHQGAGILENDLPSRSSVSQNCSLRIWQRRIRRHCRHDLINRFAFGLQRRRGRFTQA
jgi:hypothetical protein